MKRIVLTAALSAFGLFAMGQAPLKDTNQVVLQDNTVLIVDSQYMSCHYSDETSNNDTLRRHKVAPHEVHKKYRYSEAISAKKRSSRVSASTKRHD